MIQQSTDAVNRLHLPEFNLAISKSDMDTKHKRMLPIQFVSHINDHDTGMIKFIAFDSFSSHHFMYNPQNNNQEDFKSFYGLNETHMQEQNKQFLMDAFADEQEKHDSIYSPFLKHQNPQFTIQKESVILTITENQKEIDQYFYMTNDNQYMLIYPNYENVAQKNEVIF